MNLTDRLTALRDGLAISSEWLWTFIANHLWQSTLCAALAFLAVVLLRRSPARARYAIWLIAATKFFLPSVLLVGLADAAGVDLSALMPSAPHPQAVIAQVAEPVAYAPVEPAYVEPAGTAATPPRARDWYTLLTMVWLAGFVTLLAAWRRKRTQFSAAMRAGKRVSQGKEAESLKRVRSWLLLKREVQLLISPKIAEPGVWGTFRPIIVLPESIAERLSEAELDAVMMHEMIHIARQDNLVSNLQMFLCCLFWFHPLVWMIDRRLLVERESACDEQVIELGGAHGVYAASLLKVLKFCLGLRVAGVSAASGSNLKRRIEKIMSNEVNSSLALRQRLIVVALAMTVVIVSAAAGLLRRDSVAAQNRQAVAGGVQSGVQGGVPGGIPGGVPGGIAGGVAGGVPGGVEGGVPGLPQEYKIIDTDKELDQAPESVIRFRNKNNTPVSITEAKIKMVKTTGLRHRQNGIWTQTGDLYGYRATLQLVNNTGNRVKGIAIEFEDAEDNTSMAYVGQRLMIEPHATYTFNLKYGQAFFEDVTTMTARVVGVLFENGDGWGKLPPPPPPPPPPAPPSPATPPAEVGVPAPPDAPPPPPAPMVEGVVVRKAGGILQGSALRRIEPEYPPLAKAAQVSGSVVLEVVIDEGGRVIGARVLSGHPLLRDAAVGAARQWEFQPASLEGKPVKVVGTLTFTFSL